MASYLACLDPTLDQRIDRLIHRVGLDHARKRRLGEYSKVWLVVWAGPSINYDPELVIFDEPTSGLDPIGTAEVKDHRFIKHKAQRLCSHLLADVEDLCDRPVIMHQGR